MSLHLALERVNIYLKAALIQVWKAAGLSPLDQWVRRDNLLLQDVLDGMNDGTARDAHDNVTEALARSFACHAATRAGDSLTKLEMRTLVDRLFATSRPHGDPHGRVTFVRLDLEELHRRFGRS